MVHNNPTFRTVGLFCLLGLMFVHTACMGINLFPDPYPISKFAAASQDEEAKKFKQIQDRAVVYIYTNLINSGKDNKLAVYLDRGWHVSLLANPPSDAYFRLELQPGKHAFLISSKSTSIITEAGHIYFLKITQSTLQNRNSVSLVEVPDDEGRSSVSKCNLLNPTRKEPY